MYVITVNIASNVIGILVITAKLWLYVHFLSMMYGICFDALLCMSLTVNFPDSSLLLCFFICDHCGPGNAKVMKETEWTMRLSLFIAWLPRSPVSHQTNGLPDESMQ